MIVKNITNNQILIHAPAKINLYLEVLNKRSDGFHNINSVFQAVSLFDKIEFTISDKPGIEIKLLNDIGIPINKNNLIWKAYDLFAHKYAIDKGLQVKIEKNIPVSAGLGGGSSDAAATIIACNLLYDKKINHNELAGLSAEIGSDIPFFFSCGQAKVSGRGEIVEEIELPLDYSVVLVNPNIEISTAGNYSKLKRGLTNSKLLFNLAPCQSGEELFNSLKLSGNDFEKVTFDSHLALMRIKSFLIQHGAELARMSGSGPTMFGVFERKPDLNSASANCEGDWRINTVEPITFNRTEM